MRPSFFTLFKRGRYSRPPQPLESKDGSTVGASGAMNESERFVAAAIAFAWRYDEPQFRDHFWKSVCRFNDDPELTDKAEIRVEPYRWADLLITNPTSRELFVYAVELKIRAGLAEIQNPGKRQFGLTNGYGRLFLPNSMSSRKPPAFCARWNDVSHG